MRKFVALTAGLVACAAIAIGPAVAQDPLSKQIKTKVTVNAKVSPNKAGTKKNPRGVTLSGKLRWTSTAGFEPPIITDFDVLISKGGVYNGGKYPKCSQRKVDQDAGPAGCPKKSIMGSATGVALADTVLTKPDVTFVNGGAKNICFYTILYNPALVQKCVPGKVKKLGRGSKWGYRVKISVPEVLQVVAGVPIALREITFKAGGRKYAKDWIATTNCPKSRKWFFQVRTSYLYADNSKSSSAFADAIPCRR